MSQEKERSAIFKFFYVILSIITFPIYLILFVLRHPILIIFLLMLLAGGAIYWPMSQGVALNGIKDWYQAKYDDTKREVVTKAKESGAENLVPKSILDDVKRLDEEAKEALEPKGENYNKKIMRDEKVEETKAMIKKRGGFKKKEIVPSEEKDAQDEAQKKENLESVAEVSGGLSQILQHQKTESVDEPLNEAPAEAKKEPAVEQTNPQNDEKMDLDLF